MYTVAYIYCTVRCDGETSSEAGILRRQGSVASQPD